MPRGSSERTHRFAMLLSKQEREKLDVLAQEMGLDASSYLRMLMLKEYRKLKGNVYPDDE